MRILNLFWAVIFSGQVCQAVAMADPLQLTVRPHFRILYSKWFEIRK